MNDRKLRELELDAKTAGDNVDKLQRIARVDVPVLIAEIRRLQDENNRYQCHLNPDYWYEMIRGNA
jgi:hypothetical protein